MIESVIAGVEMRTESQLTERLEILDTFFEALSMVDETEQRRPVEILSELSGAIHVQIKLPSQEQRLLLEEPDQVYDTVREQVEEVLHSQAVIRLVGAVDRRLGDSLGLNARNLSSEDWGAVVAQVLSAAEDLLDKRQGRYLGESGTITRDLDNALSRAQGSLGEQAVLRLMLLLPEGAVATFDKKTHRRVFQRATRLRYTYHAAHFLEEREPEEIADVVLSHLEGAQESLRRAWGLAELKRLEDAKLADLAPEVRQGVLAELGEGEDSTLLSQPLSALPAERRRQVAIELGRRALTGVYSQLLLGVITELWVDYLTEMEALRVSIGLEAYAQRDPLVQYKTRAFELYQELLGNMRLGVVTRMFTYRPRDLSRVQAGITRVEAPRTELSAGEQGQLASEPTPALAADVPREETPSKSGKTSKKRRRRRRRR
jgi:preprotein translocase subunit SecA